MKFDYKAVASDGSVRQGRIQAGDKREAVAAIHAQGLVPLQVSVSKDQLKDQNTYITSYSKRTKNFVGSFVENWSAGKRRIKNKDLIMFSDHLATMLKAGISLNRSLTILEELTQNKSLKVIISDVHAQIREGSSMYQALQRHPRAFPPVYANMIQAGEAGGVLDSVLERLSGFLSDIQELRDYLVASMIYPVILAFTASASILVMLTVVVPRFAEIFFDMGVELPWATNVMLITGNFLKAGWWVGIFMILAGGLIFKWYIATVRGRDQWDRLKLNSPVLGRILLKVEVARFSKTLGTLLKSGVSILSAMNIVQKVVANISIQKTLNLVYNDLKQGKMLSTALEKHDIIPSLAVSMLGVGEESGNMSEMLEKIGDMYDKDLKSSIKSFTAMFEPLVILIMGLVIGAMVVSMLLAIFSLNELGI